MRRKTKSLWWKTLIHTYKQKVTKEVRCKHFSQAFRGDIILLGQDPLTSGKHGNHIAVVETQGKC